MTLNELIKFAKENEVDFNEPLFVVSSDYDSEDDSTWSSDTQTDINHVFVKSNQLFIQTETSEFM